MGIIQVIRRKKETLKQEAKETPVPNQNYNIIS